MNKQELIDAGKFIQFPNSKTSYKNYGELPGSQTITRLPLTDRMYTNWSLNSNHFQTSYHIDTVLPIIAEVLDIRFSIDDFTLDERKADDRFDISVLKPNQDFVFDIYGLSTDEFFADVKYDFLTSSHLTSAGLTEYHKLYRFSHLCSRIINKTTAFSRTLFISGDSQMIPDIAHLACYFRELWFMDNRNNSSFSRLYEEIRFTDVLFELNNNAESFYLD